MANDSHERDSCFWYKKRGDVDMSKTKKCSLDDAFDVKPKNRGFSPSSASSVQDLRHRCLEREGHRRSHQTTDAEIPITCLSLTSRFNLSKLLKPWKKGSTKHQVSSSSPSSDVLDVTTNEDMIRGSIHPGVRNAYKFNSPFITFSLSELRKATHDFSKENLIGRGGYAEVFKGSLKDGQLVAIKRLNKGIEAKRNSNFLAELNVIAFLDHRNTAKLIGCCSSGELCLVFQLSPLGSLASLLHGSDKEKLNWSRRYKIALGIADGLLYLHDHCHRQIIHRDIKSENILLTENFEPQICDFGLAKWLPANDTHQLATKFEGTFGYFAPEYLMQGIINEKTDVYSFGILLLELVTGRKALDYSQQSILLWAKPWLDANNIKELIDPSLGDNYNRAQVERVVLTLSLCVEHSPILRPRMSQVVVLLGGDDFIVEFGNGSPRRYLPITHPEPEESQDGIELNYNNPSALSRENKQVTWDS